jgi:hypothetical protein
MISKPLGDASSSIFSFALLEMILLFTHLFGDQHAHPGGSDETFFVTAELSRTPHLCI